MSRKHGLLMLAMTLCLGGAVPAAQAKNTLNCTVVDENDKPISKQEFVLTSAAGKEHKKKTNDQGEAKFGGLDDGSYTLNGRVEGYVAGQSAPMEVSGNTEKPCHYKIISAAYANARLAEVMQLVQQRKFAEAEDAAKKLIEIMPNEGAAHYVLAVTYAYEGKAEAEAAIKKAAELSPDKFKDKEIPIRMQSLNQQADMAKQKRDFAGAIQKYEAMLAISPNDPTVFYNMAVTHASANNLAEALKNIEKVLVLRPEDAEAKQLRDRFEKQFEDELNKELKK